MSGSISPGIAAAIIVVVLVVVAIFGYRALGPRNDGPTHPVNMAAMMKGAGSSASRTPYKVGP